MKAVSPLLSSGFAPRQGFEELSALFCGNLSDHISAAALNLQGEANFLEQSVFVDEITAASAKRMHKVSVAAWKQALKTVMQEAQMRFDADAEQAAPEQRQHRARFGVYFYSQERRHEALASSGDFTLAGRLPGRLRPRRGRYGYR